MEFLIGIYLLFGLTIYLIRTTESKGFAIFCFISFVVCAVICGIFIVKAQTPNLPCIGGGLEFMIDGDDWYLVYKE